MIRVSFGLFNSQSSYQKLMDNTLKNVDRAESYLNDIHSLTFDQHLVDLDSTFQAVKKSNYARRNTTSVPIQ